MYNLLTILYRVLLTATTLLTLAIVTQFYVTWNSDNQLLEATRAANKELKAENAKLYTELVNTADEFRALEGMVRRLREEMGQRSQRGYAL